MDRKNIVEQLLKKGVLVSPRDLGKINDSNLSSFLGGRKEKVVRISVDDFLKKTKEDIIFLQNELVRKIDPVSVNKVGQLQANTSIAGLVKEITGRGFMLQDKTGEIEVVTEQAGIDAGSVVGVRGFMKNGLFLAEVIHWPDIPLGKAGRETGDAEIFFSNGKETGGNQIVLKAPEPGSMPATETVSAGNGQYQVLFIGSETTEDEAVSMLKKRRIRISGFFEYTIKDVPDFVWFYDNKSDWSRNYKGVAIISTAKGSAAVFSLSDRVVRFL